MVQFLSEYGLFLLKTFTLVFALLLAVGGIFALSRKDDTRGSSIKVKNLNNELEEKESELQEAMLSKKAFKAYKKQVKQAQKQQQAEERPKLFVLDFKGDMRASQVESLRELVTMIISIAKPKHDEVLLRLESPGGLVSGYGLAASQLNRFKEAQISLTIAVDQVAASGGYLMACVADKIIAAPFAIIGSIGVITATPNFHKVLKKNDVDYEQFTAGEYKRTVTVFGETTDEAREKRQEQVDEIHTLFKNFIRRHRPQVDISQVATGEYWLASDTTHLNLIDELSTSDDYLFEHYTSRAIYHMQIDRPKPLLERLMKKGEDSLLKYQAPRKELYYF